MGILINSFAYWIIFLWSVDFFKINFFEKFFQEYLQSVKQFGSRSGLTSCQGGGGGSESKHMLSLLWVNTQNIIL